MATIFDANVSISLDMERTGQWFASQIPTDVIVQVGESKFPLHKFMLVAKSNYLRKVILESINISRIDLSGIPGGAEAFQRVFDFCYGVNFEVTVHNVAPIRCAAEYLEMSDKYCENNLIGRTEDFLSQVALKSLPGTLAVLRSCEDVIPMAEDLGIVRRCVEVASAKACVEAIFPTRSPPNWWTEELTILGISFFEKIITAMKLRGAKSLSLASAITVYAERSFNGDNFGIVAKSSTESDVRAQQQDLLKAIVALMPTEKMAFPVKFLCHLLRTAIFLRADGSCKTELEKRISSMLDRATVDDLLVLSFTYDGERMFDLESVRRIISGFVERDKSVAVFNAGDFREVCSAAMQRVAKTVEAYLAEISTHRELNIAKFNGIANLVPKEARKGDDNLYRAVDIYLKAHPNLDEIEREKLCSVMDPLKLSYEARIHASQNKRLPVQIVLHALYYDQLKSRSKVPDADATRNQVHADVSLAKENEALRTEILHMKMYIQDMQKTPRDTSSSSSSKNGIKKMKLFSFSKTLGRLNPFKNTSKDTSHIDDGKVDFAKPKKRRFSIS
ncbi:root phototropism protein 2-like [Andrographis paniculata]|uniref:root phototropism protein 2-like n=1 Tax=Andrographis paniculata TaxID=175694 RepID=UPI0021E8CFEB|nr:root phototropism protein 2-like [Andrographis paniculata]